MRTAHSPTVRVSVASHKMSLAEGSSSKQIWTGLWTLPPDVTSGGPQMNKFEQVSGLSKVSLLGRGAGIMKWRPCTGLGLGDVPVQRGSLYGEVQGIMGNGHMGTPCEQMDWQTHTTENITFQQLSWREVITSYINPKLIIQVQSCHGTGKTGNLDVHFSRQEKHWEFA